MASASADPEEIYSPDEQLLDILNKTTGELIEQYAPEIFDLICEHLEMSVTELRQWNHDETLGDCGAMAFAPQLVYEGFIHGQVVFEDFLTQLHLGEHHAFGELKIDVAGAPPHRMASGDHLYRAIRKLLPEWIEAAGRSTVTTTVETSTWPGPDSKKPPYWDEYSPAVVTTTTTSIPPEPDPPNIHVETEYGSHYFQGLFWKEDYFLEYTRWAVATLHAHRADAENHVVTEANVDFWAIVTDLSAECAYTTGLIEDLVWFGYVVLRATPTNQDAADPACTFEGAYWLLTIHDNGAPEWTHAYPDARGQGGYDKPGGSVHPTICGLRARGASSADFHFWWATRLFDVAKDCRSPWAMLMAALSARVGLAEILSQAAVILHELGHEDANTHCSFMCCQDAVAGWWFHRQLARYGCPIPWEVPTPITDEPGIANVITGRPPDRWMHEKWAYAVDGSTGCERSKFIEYGTHCRLLTLEHVVKHTVKYNTGPHGAACYTASDDYPVKVKILSVPEGETSCFPE